MCNTTRLQSLDMVSKSSVQTSTSHHFISRCSAVVFVILIFAADGAVKLMSKVTSGEAKPAYIVVSMGGRWFICTNITHFRYGHY